MAVGDHPVGRARHEPDDVDPRHVAGPRAVTCDRARDDVRAVLVEVVLELGAAMARASAMTPRRDAVLAEVRAPGRGPGPRGCPRATPCRRSPGCPSRPSAPAWRRGWAGGPTGPCRASTARSARAMRPRPGLRRGGSSSSAAGRRRRDQAGPARSGRSRARAGADDRAGRRRPARHHVGGSGLIIDSPAALSASGPGPRRRVRGDQQPEEPPECVRRSKRRARPGRRSEPKRVGPSAIYVCTR